MRHLLKWRPLRFALVGVVNTGFSYSVYAILLYLGVHYMVATLCSIVLGILFSFRTQGRLVFGNSDNGLLSRFVAVWAGIFCAHTVFITCLIYLGVNAYWAGAAAVVPVALLSYFVQKRFVFGSAKTAARNEPLER